MCQCAPGLIEPDAHCVYVDAFGEQSVVASLLLCCICVDWGDKMSIVPIKYLKTFGCNFKSSYLCIIARLVHLWAAGGLIYKKDVFERLSL